MITVIAHFTMRRNAVPGALRLIRAVKRQAEAEQPGTLVYLVHRKLDKQNRPLRTLVFYERYRGMRALNAHLNSSSWQAVVKNWPRYFEGASAKSSKFFNVKRLAAFARPGAIRVVRAKKRARN
jgi:quinol monooxygenase YgiN